MCSYKEKKSEPSEMMQLDGYTVDYIEAASGIFIELLLMIMIEVKTDIYI